MYGTFASVYHLPSWSFEMSLHDMFAGQRAGDEGPEGRRCLLKSEAASGLDAELGISGELGESI